MTVNAVWKPRSFMGKEFFIEVYKGEVRGYVAYAPEVGGVYEEGETMAEAEQNAYDAACAIITAREKGSKDDK